jgi:hypothetical protein
MKVSNKNQIVGLGNVSTSTLGYPGDRHESPYRMGFVI